MGSHVDIAELLWLEKRQKVNHEKNAITISSSSSLVLNAKLCTWMNHQRSFGQKNLWRMGYPPRSKTGRKENSHHPILFSTKLRQQRQGYTL